MNKKKVKKPADMTKLELVKLVAKQAKLLKKTLSENAVKMADTRCESKKVLKLNDEAAGLVKDLQKTVEAREGQIDSLRYQGCLLINKLERNLWVY